MARSGRTFLLLLIMAAAVVPAPFHSAEPESGSAGGREPVELDSYPLITPEEMGQLRFFLMIADQPVSDFSRIGADDQKGDTAYRYSLAFMVYYLALTHFHKLPACPELIQPRMDRLIQKMIQKPVWEYWAEVSRGVPSLEPLYNRPYPEQHDPVADQNIMYSGHLGHMIGLYEMLYRDFKWDKQGSIVFAWSEEEKYLYDHHSLVKVMHDQMKNNPWHSIACEPNAVFPACNQHPLMSFLLYDYLHQASFSQVLPLHLDFLLERKLLNLQTRHFGGYYLIKQDTVVGGIPPAVSPAMDGWTGTFMHVWQPELIERLYPAQRRYHLTFVSRSQARLSLDVVGAEAVKYGFFAQLAAEMGDLETRDKLLRAADKIYQPRWQDGMFFYPLREKPVKTSFLTGVLLACARANPGGGFRAMHTQPFADSHFNQPYLAGIDYPRLLLQRAIYDSDKEALIVTTMPGTAESGRTTFYLRQLDPAKRWRLLVDGREEREIHGQTEVKVEVTLDQPHQVVLTARP